MANPIRKSRRSTIASIRQQQIIAASFFSGGQFAPRQVHQIEPLFAGSFSFAFMEEATMMTRVLGGFLLVASLGLASCQAVVHAI